ncbi:MAG: hypothetical protein JSV14_09590, partial [Deltaproteobacteria bacterium]
MELEELQLALKNIQNNEATVRSFLGFTTPAEAEDRLGQGGLSATTPPPSGSKDIAASGEVRSPTKIHFSSVLEQAKFLQERVQELVEIIREQRDLLDRT